MSSTHQSTARSTTRPDRNLTAIGASVAVVASALTAFGAHTWAEVLVTVPVILGVTALVFGLLVPRALSKQSAPGVALGLSIPAALLLLPAFWAGLPAVLGVGAVLVGDAGRSARRGAGACTAGLVLGALVVLGYLAIYAYEIVSGASGFAYL